MKTKISILLLIISFFQGYSQLQSPTWFGGGIKLYNATEQTDFLSGHERIPLMQTNGIINSFIHSDSLVIQSQIKGFALLNAENTFKERNIFEKEIIVLTNGNDNLFNNNTIHNGLFTANGGLNSNGTTTLAGTQNFSGTLTMSGVMNYDPIITNAIIDSESDNIIINKRWFNANTKTYQAGTNITIDNTDPLNPVINATGGGGTGSSNTYTNGLTLSSNNVDLGGELTQTDTRLNISDNVKSFGVFANTFAPSSEAIKTGVRVKGNELLLQAGVFSDSIQVNGRVKIRNFIDFRNGGSSTAMYFGTGYGAAQAEDVFISSTPSNPMQITVGDDATYDVTLTDNVFTSPNAVVNKQYIDNAIAGVSGGGGATNLNYTASSTNGVITSSTGTNATIPTVTSTNAGLQKPNFYEEGTFTPDIIDTNGGATYTFTVSGATYVRTGNIVRVNVLFTNINTTGTPSPPSSYFYVDNMPFISATGGNGYNGGELIQFAGSTLTEDEVQNLTPFMPSGFDRVRFQRKTEYQPRSQVSFTAGVLAFSITYITNVYTP